MPPTAERPLSIVVSDDELALLKKLSFPCSEEVLASAEKIEDEGNELFGTWSEFDMLVGFVAAEANYARKHRRPRQTALLDSIADELEAELAFYRRQGARQT